jgi:hypothetical protein
VNVANVHTINANTYLTVAGLNVVDHINSAFSTANSKVESINVSGNGLSVSNSTTLNLNQYTLSVNSATTIERGTTLLIDSISSSDIANAATANAVKTAWDYANTKLSLSGGTINGSLNVSGNLTITGQTKYINVETYSVTDPLIYLAANNETSDLVDIGFMGGHNTSGVYQHSGLVRDAGDGTWYLFTGLLDEGHENNVVDFANTTLATLRSNIAANSITLVGNTVATQANLTLAHDQANTAHNQANAAYAQANLAYDAANNAKVTVFANNASNVTTQNLNFVNTATVTVVVSPDGSNANVEFIAAPQTVVDDTFTAAGNTAAAATANIANGLYQISTSAFEKANAPITVREIYATNANIVNSFANINTLQFDTESGMAVVDESNNTVTIKLNSTFKYWNINGSPGLEAFGLDTVNFIPLGGLEITANNSNTPKSFVISTENLANNTANAANTVSLSVNGAGTLYNKKLNFVNTANVSVTVVDNGDGNANIAFATTFTGAAGLLLSDRFTGTGACTQFGLTQTSTNDRTFVFLNGVSQKPGVDFTVNDALLTMNVAPSNGTVLEVRTFSSIDLTDVTKIYSDTFNGNGTSNTFTLTESSATTKTLVYIDGVCQRPTTDYTVAGKTLTFTTPPLSNTVIEARSFSTVAIGNVSSIQSDVFTGTGACTAFTLGTNSTTRGSFVFVDGVVQVPTTDYSVSNNIVTFNSPPEANAVIEIRSISDLNLVVPNAGIANGLHKLELTTKGSFFTNGGFATETDSVSRNYILRGTTTGNTETELFYNTNMRIPVNANTTVFYTADIVARRTDAIDESAGFSIKGVVDNFSDTVADVGDLYELIVAEDDAGLLVDARADDTNNSINIYVTGSTGKTIRWTAFVKTVEVAQ